MIVVPTDAAISSAALALSKGALVAVPTETVYGLAADARNSQALQRMYLVKNRPKEHPVIVHIGSIEYLDYWTKEIPTYAIQLANTFWPGPMTLVLKKSRHVDHNLTGGQQTIGIRIPKHDVAKLLFDRFHELGGKGLAMPSANRFGAVSPTDAQAVVKELRNYLDSSTDKILDGGICEVGLESTIINCSEEIPEILRPGAITFSKIKSVAPICKVKNLSHSNLKFSGNYLKHYAPKAKVVFTGNPNKGDGFLALISISTPKNCIRLASPKNSNEFAQILYNSFRKADEMKLKQIYVKLPHGNGIETAIIERVYKAAGEQLS